MFKLIWKVKGHEEHTENFKDLHKLNLRFEKITGELTSSFIEYSMQIIYPNNYVITINTMKMGIV